MLTTLYHFADLLKDVDNLQTYFSPAKNPFDGNEDNAKVLVGEIENRKFTGFSLEDFNTGNVDKYLYKKAKGRATNIVPTLIINTTDPEKTFGKFVQSINNYDLDLLDEKEIEKVKSEIENYDFNNDYSYLLTFRIDGEYFGDINRFWEIYQSNVYSDYYEKKYEKEYSSRQENQLCALIGEKATVYGFVGTLGFTVNDGAFRRNGFNADDAYKMFPISKEAIPILEGAKAILENKLASTFYSYKSGKRTKYVKYAVVPHFVFQPNKEVASEIAHSFLDKATFNVDSKEDAGSKAFINGTESLLQAIIKDNGLSQTDIYYAMLFFEDQQSQFKIHLEINDVLPSRISKIISCKERAEKRYKTFTTYQTKDGNIKTQRITLYGLREYFKTGEDNIQPAFYKLISSIFTGQSYNDSTLLKLVLATWKSSFKKNFHDQENTFNYLIKYSLGNLYFLNLLGIFKNEHIMNKEQKTSAKQDAFTFIEAHPAYFEKEYLKGAFIFGCLVARLLYNQPGNAFMKELYGLNIDKDLITKKFPKLISKLRQYDVAFPDMESAAARFFAKDDQKVTKDETSFAFTMGLVLQKDFDRINKNTNQNSDNDE